MTLAALAGAQTDAAAAPSGLAKLAEGAVVARTSPSGIRTGFAFGRAGLFITSSSGAKAVDLISARGENAAGAAVSRQYGLVAVRAPELRLVLISGSGLRDVSSRTRAYVLGPPLGYEDRRIRAVRLPAFNSRSRRLVRVAGRLPQSFQGAPVVTQSGEVIGAVARAGASSWTLVSSAPLQLLVASAVKPSGGAGFPVVLIGMAVLVVMLALGSVIVSRTTRRRRRSRQMRASVSRSSMRHPAERSAWENTGAPAAPLVKRRTSETIDEEDFDVVLKSQGHNEPS
jgi:hypothetical protein